MPSRAVIRKKARRDAKKKKAETQKAQVVEAAAQVVASKEVVRTATTPSSSSRHEASDSAPVVVPERKVLAVAPRPRAPVVPFVREVMPEGLTHKQRKKWESKQKLMKQMSRLAATAPAPAPTPTPADGEATTAAPAEGSTDSPAGAEAAEQLPKERHDPRWSNGTFWRNRKERRARTLFLGGIPTKMSQQDIKDFIMTVLDSDAQASAYVKELSAETPAVEEVDFLPLKHYAKLRHMYVAMASVPLAGCAALLLDGYKMEQQKLRCNFASDKTQRSVAIKRRGDHY